MKKICITLVLAAFTMSASAQKLVRSHILDGYKEGDKLEKFAYEVPGEPIEKNTWCGAFYKNGNSAPSPIIGKALTYEGYHEGGPSVKFGGFPAGKRNSRMTVFSVSEKSNLRRGSVYISMLVNFAKLGNANMSTIFAADASYKGNKPRANIYVAKDGESKVRFGVGLMKLRANGENSYDLNKTHLLVFKLDFKNQQVSLLVNPELGIEEPAADIVVDATEGTRLNAAITGLTIYNRSGYEGNIGNFRLATDWSSIVNPEEVVE